MHGVNWLGIGTVITVCGVLVGMYLQTRTWTANQKQAREKAVKDATESAVTEERARWAPQLADAQRRIEDASRERDYYRSRYDDLVERKRGNGDNRPGGPSS